MSYDFQIAGSCNHTIVGERVEISVSRTSLVTSRNISGEGLLQITAGGVVVPRGGAFVPVELLSGKEPFRASASDREILVRVDGTPFSRSLPVGHFGVAQAIRAIGNLPGVVLSSESGRIIARSGVADSLSFSRGPLGFSPSSSSRRQVFPSWFLTSSPSGTLIALSSPLLSNPLVEVSYPVLRKNCPRCGGSGVENDFQAGTGEVKRVTGHNLLYQSAMKIILTRLGSNPYHLWYGSSVWNGMRGKSLPGVEVRIRESVMAALSKLQDLQSQQSKYQRVSPEERLYSVTGVEVSGVEGDPTSFLLDVEVMSFSYLPVNISIVFTVPGAMALAGTNRLSLGT